MMTVSLTCGGDGAFRSCCGEGHAGYAPAGSDIVCAAATVLLRTGLQVLSEDYGASVLTEAPEPGTLAFRVRDGIEDRSRLVYAADFLRAGMTFLHDEYPQHIVFTETIAE